MKDKEPTKVNFGSREHLEWAQVAVFEQTKLLQVIHDSILDPKDKRAMTFAQTLMNIFETSRSILLLCRTNMRDSYALGRVVFELALNLGYYDSKEGMIDKALKHAHQKSLRDIFRRIIVEENNIKYDTKMEEGIVMPKNLQEAFDEFTSSKGLEIRTWTGDPKDNIYKKIEIITTVHGKKAEVDLNLCLFIIYRHASEVIHGTLFGTMFGLGLTELKDERPQTNEEVLKHIMFRNSLLLNCINNLLNFSIRVVGERYDIKESEEKSLKIRNELTAIYS